MKIKHDHILGKPGSAAGLYDFGDVVQSIRNNETSAEVVKKFLSAAAALSERSDSNPVFMMWTIPTTILALLGMVYFVGEFIHKDRLIEKVIIYIPIFYLVKSSTNVLFFYLHFT